MNLIDKNLGRMRPRPQQRRDDIPGWLGPIAVIGGACCIYTALSLAYAVSLVLGGW